MNRLKVAQELLLVAKEIDAAEKMASFNGRDIKRMMEDGGIPSRLSSQVEKEAERIYNIISILRGKPRVEPWAGKDGVVIGYQIGNDSSVGWIKGVGLNVNYRDYFGHYHEYAYDKGQGRRSHKPAGYDQWAAKYPERENALMNG